MRHRHQLDQRREAADGAVADGAGRGERFLALAPDVRVDVPLVRERSQQVEVAERDAGGEEWRDGRLAAETSARRTGREFEIEADGDERLVLDRLEQQEFVLELDVADAAG